MSVYKIHIPWEPRPKASIRLGQNHYYNPSATGMKKTREYVREQMLEKNMPVLRGPLFVIMHFRIPAPLSLTTPKRMDLHMLPHAKRPDGDNLEKFLNDSLNGVLWVDDAHIAWLLRSKTLTFDKKGSTTVYVKPLDINTPNYYAMYNFIGECMNYDDGSDIPHNN